jgi:hypothetical protein
MLKPIPQSIISIKTDEGKKGLREQNFRAIRGDRTAVFGKIHYNKRKAC